MSGILNMLLASGVVVKLSGQTITDGTSISASLQVSNDGKVYEQTGVGGNVQIDTATDWVRPLVGMSNYYVRATLNSGALTAGTTGSWLQLNSARTWNILGVGSANLTIEIAGDSGGVSVLTSNTYILQVT